MATQATLCHHFLYLFVHFSRFCIKVVDKK